MCSFHIINSAVYCTYWLIKFQFAMDKQLVLSSSLYLFRNVWSLVVHRTSLSFYRTIESFIELLHHLLCTMASFFTLIAYYFMIFLSLIRSISRNKMHCLELCRRMLTCMINQNICEYVLRYAFYYMKHIYFMYA